MKDEKFACITKTRLYNFDPLKPHVYSKTGVYRGEHYFSYFAKNKICGYSLAPPRQGDSNEYPQSMFWAEIWIISDFFIWNFSFLCCKIFQYIWIGVMGCSQ